MSNKSLPIHNMFLQTQIRRAFSCLTGIGQIMCQQRHCVSASFLQMTYMPLNVQRVFGFFNMVTILMMSVKMTILHLLEIKIFSSKGFDVIIYVHDVIIVFSCDSYKNLTRKATFFEAWSWFKSQFRIGTRYGLKISHQCGKRVKTKSQKVLEVNSCVYRSCRGPILNRVKRLA